MTELDVRVVGAARGIEARALPGMEESLEVIAVSPLKGKGLGSVLRGVGALPRAAADSLALLRRVDPDLVIGVGGYASGPVLAAAATLGKRTAVLEQNAHVGLTNRLLAPFVGRAYVSFEETVGRFPEASVRLTGNPVRRAIVEAAGRASMDPEGFEARARSVLVLGGSQGARSLNEHVPALLAKAGVRELGVRVIHQSGESERAQVVDRYAALGVDAEVVPFIADMASAYAGAMFVLGRSGATSVAEICALGRPSVLVPFPHAADDHQTKNARSLEARGAALCVAQGDLQGPAAERAVSELLRDAERRRRMAAAARTLGKPDAAAAIVDDLLEWSGEVSSDGGDRSADPSSRSAGERGPSNLRSTDARGPSYAPAAMSWSRRRLSSVPPHRRVPVDIA
ncbi:MAG: UDP-N-acetylglucosamine--N-acetylmuramyl-(pentapeptide) pyrophosphoryl-undecaprenol N-acetylglucosamine transferase, partial [Myxococcales bacterium]|nr:UDP-N-acetylglucosamine--N-acetylmuramyl-(pentapeptide) pyrophosphoryl-undecaprenol N-acetylglucosamine transferase [Myxococcales bacterium]